MDAASAGLFLVLEATNGAPKMMVSAPAAQVSAFVAAIGNSLEGVGVSVTHEVVRVIGTRNSIGVDLSAAAAMAVEHETLIQSAQAFVTGVASALPTFPEVDQHFAKIMAARPAGPRRPLPKK